MIQGTKIYKVTVTGGQIDNHKASDYKDFDSNKINAYTVDEMINKAKANMRFYNVCMALQKGLDTMFDIETTGDKANAVASQISFKLAYTQDDGLWVECEDGTKNAETLRDGRFIVKGADAIEKLIKDACKKSNALIEYFEPRLDMNGSDGNLNTKSSNAPFGWTSKGVEIDETTPSVEVEEIVEIETKMSLIK